MPNAPYSNRYVQAKKMKKQIAINIIIIIILFSSCENKSVNSLKNNYDENSKEIIELKEHFDKIVSENFIVRIQFNSSNNIDLFVYEKVKNSTNRNEIFSEWNVNLDNPKELTSLDFVNKKLNWDRESFKELYEKIGNANCIGISNRNPVEIEYGFMGMGLLSYLVLDNNLTDKEGEAFSDDCMQMFYKDNIVLKYGSGATGSLCTHEFKRKK